MDKDDE
ncbi:627669df-41ab-49e4-86dd-a2569210d176 [Thermothielavioides terrestris]|nr:627669df-41ab-49e4-86dd-a2569210d176 [Thermothielavioides terrestris]